MVSVPLQRALLTGLCATTIHKTIYHQHAPNTPSTRASPLQERALVAGLLDLDQGHLFEGWPEKGESARRRGKRRGRGRACGKGERRGREPFAVEPACDVGGGWCRTQDNAHPTYLMACPHMHTVPRTHTLAATPTHTSSHTRRHRTPPRATTRPHTGTDDASKRRLLTQLCVLDASYHGGLAAYVANARQLLRDSKEGESSVCGCVCVCVWGGV